MNGYEIRKPGEIGQGRIIKGLNPDHLSMTPALHSFFSGTEDSAVVILAPCHRLDVCVPSEFMGNPNVGWYWQVQPVGGDEVMSVAPSRVGLAS